MGENKREKSIQILRKDFKTGSWFYGSGDIGTKKEEMYGEIRLFIWKETKQQDDV